MKLLNIIIYIFITFIILLWGYPASPQHLLSAPVPIYSNLTKGAKGLSSNLAFRVFTDRFGYIWLATEKGMMVYNGRQFTRINLPGNDQEIVVTWHKGDQLLCFSYSGNIININVLTRKAKLFCNTDTGISSKINHTPFILCHQIADSLYLLNSSGAFITMPVSCIYDTGKVTVNNNWRIGQAFFHRIMAHTPAYEAGLVNDYDLYMALGSSEHSVKMKNNTLVYRNKIFYVHQDHGISLLFDGDKAVKQGEVINDYLRHGNDLLVGYFNGSGLVCYRNFFLQSPYTVLPDPVVILPDIAIAALTMDISGNICVATLGNGLYLFTPEGLSLQYYSCTDTRQFYSQDIHFISIKGDELITGYDHAVADIRKGKEVLRIAGTPLLERNPVKYVYEEGDKIHMVTQKGSYITNAQRQTAPLFPQIVKDIYEQDGNLYLNIKGRYIIKNSKGTIAALVPSYANISIAPAADSGFLLATTHGLYHDTTRITAMGNERILKVRQYHGTILAGTTTGLHILKPAGQHVFLNTGNGLAGNYCIQATNYGRYYYVLTDGGLSVIDTNSLRVAHTYSTETLIPGLEINYFTINEGKIWMGTNKGIIVADEYTTGHYIQAPPVHIIAGDTLKKNYISDTTTRIFSRSQPVFFDIDILDNSSQQSLISYHIETPDGHQVLAPQQITDRTFSVNGLWPGQYTIYVTVRSIHDTWWVSRKHVLIITPLWWQLIWVQVLAFLLLTGSIILASRHFYLRKAMKAQQQLEQQNHMLQLQSRFLFSRLKPHFIFNALNPLQPLIIQQQTREALQYIAQFSKLMRNMITLWRSDYVTLKKEVEFLQQYIFVQQRRFDTAFPFILDIPPGEWYDRILLPSMLLQPLIENAIEHGILLSGDPGDFVRVTVSADELHHLLHITVFNSGSSLPEHFTPVADHALYMIIERMQLLKEETGTGGITYSNKDGGVCCALILPLKTEQNTSS